MGKLVLVGIDSAGKWILLSLLAALVFGGAALITPSWSQAVCWAAAAAWFVLAAGWIVCRLIAVDYYSVADVSLWGPSPYRAWSGPLWAKVLWVLDCAADPFGGLEDKTIDQLNRLGPVAKLAALAVIRRRRCFSAAQIAEVMAPFERILKVAAKETEPTAGEAKPTKETS